MNESIPARIYTVGWYQADNFPLHTDMDFSPYYFDGALWYEANDNGYMQVNPLDVGTLRKLEAPDYNGSLQNLWDLLHMKDPADWTVVESSLHRYIKSLSSLTAEADN